MPTGSSRASAAPPRPTATSKDGRGRAVAPTWSVPPWPPRPASRGTSSTFADSRPTHPHHEKNRQRPASDRIPFGSCRLQYLRGHGARYRTRGREDPAKGAIGGPSMDKLTIHRGIVAPLDRANVDTDAIIPKQFLKSIKRSGFGPNLFDEWRYLVVGEPGMDNSRRPHNPDFVLNQ